MNRPQKRCASCHASIRDGEDSAESVTDEDGVTRCHRCYWSGVNGLRRLRGEFSPVELYRARVLRHAFRAGKAVCPGCGPGVRCRCSVDQVADFITRQGELAGVLDTPQVAVPAKPGAQGRFF
jgi:hypothetical protein